MIVIGERNPTSALDFDPGPFEVVTGRGIGDPTEQGFLGAPIPDGRYFVPTGCEYCEKEGFTGRAPISELLIMRPELRQAVITCRTTNEIFETAKQYGLVPLIADGLARASRGETSLAEVLRVTG